MIPSSFLSSQQFADAHLCKYYSIFFSFGLHLIYSVSEHKKSGVTVHSVHSNIAKIHSRLPAAMEFWLVCLGILAYSCQNTSRNSGVWIVTIRMHDNIRTETHSANLCSFYKYTVFFRNCYKLYGWFLTFSHTWRHFASTNFVQKIFIKKFSFGSFHL